MERNAELRITFLIRKLGRRGAHGPKASSPPRSRLCCVLPANPGAGCCTYAVVQLLLQAGLRVSEAALLRIEDLDIRERQGSVRIRGKGEKEPHVPLNVTARRALQAYLDERGETATQDPVFLSDTGAALSVRSVQTLVSELARRATLRGVTIGIQSRAFQDRPLDERKSTSWPPLLRLRCPARQSFRTSVRGARLCVASSPMPGSLGLRCRGRPSGGSRGRRSGR